MRALLITFLVTLLSFAVSLLLGIIGTTLVARICHVAPDVTVAYRRIALPVAAVVGPITLLMSFAMEIRQYRQAKTLASIERAG